MNILLVGQESVVTETIYQMLTSTEDWQTTLMTSWQNLEQQMDSEYKEKSLLDVIVANLADFSDQPLTIINHLVSQFSPLPLLVLNSYQRRFLIDPLLEGGALGYVQIGVSEDNLLNAVSNVVKGKKCIITENT